MKRALEWLDDDIDAQAAYWFVVLRSEDVSKSERRAFDIWHRADSAHAQVYERLCRNWIAAEALAQDDAIIGLRDSALLPRAKRIPERPLLAIFGLAASLVFALALTLVFGDAPIQDTQTRHVADLSAAPQADAPLILSTEIGERSTIQLADGSSVELNTDTQVEVRYTQSRRSLLLVKGQALFKVAKNPDRPFVVFAGGRVITALGTEFEVRMHEQDVSVTLVEGRVQVRQVNADTVPDPLKVSVQSVELVAGQVYDSARGSLSEVSEDAIERALSWRQGRLEFQNERLIDVVFEINRYSRRKLVLEDPSVGELFISGSFKAGSVENFATAMTALYPLALENGAADEVLVLSWSKG